MKKTYFKVSIFALGSLGGGSWEDDTIVSGSSPQEAYTNALRFLESKGFAFQSEIEVCDKHGEPLD